MIAALVLTSGARPASRPSAARPASPGFPRLAEQWLALRAAGLDPLRIAVGAGAVEIASASGLSRENFVADRTRARTAFSELQAGLEALLAADDWPAVVLQPAGSAPPHPSVILALVQRFAEGDVPVVVPAHRGRAGFPVVLARSAAEAFLDLDPRRAELGAVLASLEEAGAAARLEVYTAEVLPRARPGGRRARRWRG
jgi:CTP:molybdopterin cytidylyltransferase MocA